MFLPQDNLWHLFSLVAPGKVWLLKNPLILAVLWFPLASVLIAPSKAAFLAPGCSDIPSWLCFLLKLHEYTALVPLKYAHATFV